MESLDTVKWLKNKMQGPTLDVCLIDVSILQRYQLFLLRRHNMASWMKYFKRYMKYMKYMKYFKRYMDGMLFLCLLEMQIASIYLRSFCKIFYSILIFY